VLTTGATGSGRKGTATSYAVQLFARVDPFFQSRLLSGLSSGEGLIKGVSPVEGDKNVRCYLAVFPNSHYIRVGRSICYDPAVLQDFLAGPTHREPRRSSERRAVKRHRR
jgi:hypothetical protein